MQVPVRYYGVPGGGPTVVRCAQAHGSESARLDYRFRIRNASIARLRCRRSYDRQPYLAESGIGSARAGPAIGTPGRLDRAPFSYRYLMYRIAACQRDGVALAFHLVCNPRLILHARIFIQGVGFSTPPS